MKIVDSMGVAIDWLDAYRARSLSIVGLYSDTASIDCGCGGQTILTGHAAIAEYWRRQFVQQPAGELEDLFHVGTGVAVRYRAAEALVQALLYFDNAGLIERSYCKPTTEIVLSKIA